MTVVHVVAGSIALVSGAIALYALKGARLHRKSGMFFVYAMLVMASTGAVMATLEGKPGSIAGGTLTFYLVFTGLRTARQRVPGEASWVDRVAAVGGGAVGAGCLTFGALASGPNGIASDQPPPLFFIFGIIALLATVGDVRRLSGAVLTGQRRLARHLWRMNLAMFIATASFFLGQARLFPRSVRDSGVLAVPVLIVVALMVYWPVRMRLTSRLRGLRGMELT